MRTRSIFQLTLIVAFAAAGTIIAGCAGPVANSSNLAAARPAVNSPAAAPAFSPPAVEPDNAERISLADAKKDFDAGNAVFVDVRSAEVYKIEHIKGALNIPISEIAANINKLPKGKKIIAYCS